MSTELKMLEGLPNYGFKFLTNTLVTCCDIDLNFKFKNISNVVKDPGRQTENIKGAPLHCLMIYGAI